MMIVSYIAQWRKDDEISGSDIVIFVLGLIGIVILIAVMLYYSKRILDRARKLRQDEEQGEDLDTLVGNHSDDEDGEWPKHHSDGLLMDEDELDQPV
jgi:hypothetical protein